MDLQALDARCRKIVVRQLACDPAEVIDEASFIDDLGADSLDFIELTMEFEEEFDVRIPDDEAADLLTFGATKRWLANALSVAA